MPSDANKEIFRLRRVLQAFGIVVAIITATAIPLGYSVISYTALGDELALRSKISAQKLAQYVYTHGDMWSYAPDRLEAMIDGDENSTNDIQLRILEANGGLIAGDGKSIEWLSVSRREPIVVDQRTMGFIETSASAKPLANGVFWALLIGISLSVSIYLILRTLPLHALDRSLVLLQDEIRKTEEARKDAERANRLKSDFLANLSHEFRTPLNAILGFSEMIQISKTRGGDDPITRYRDYAGNIHESGQLLLHLIGDLLDLSKAEAGRIELDRRRIDVNATIRRCCTVVDGRAREAGITLTNRTVNDAPLTFHADELRVKQVLLNVLSNAVKFTPRGGAIIVGAERFADGGVEIVVRDDGIGMDPALIPRALEPYRQLEQEATIKSQGTGLGLPLSNRLMELHGGRLVIESDLGRGTTVRLIFPPPPETT